MSYLRKHRGFVTLGMLSLGAAVTLAVLLGVVTGFAFLCGSILGGVISLGVSDIREKQSDAIDMRDS